MINITYTYEVESVNEATRSMMLIYKSPGKQEFRVGTRLPYVGETLDQIAAMYSPASHWVTDDAIVVVPTIGTKGSWNPPTTEELAQLEETNKANHIQYMEMENVKLTAKIQSALTEMMGASV